MRVTIFDAFGDALSRCVVLLFLFAAALVPAKAADDVAPFYGGKQIRFIIGSAPGGTYDVLARIVARHMAAHIPGHPLIIVQNQPAASGPPERGAGGGNWRYPRPVSAGFNQGTRPASYGGSRSSLVAVATQRAMSAAS